MQQVEDRWYRLYYAVATAMGLLVLLGSLATLYIPSFDPIASRIGLNLVTLIAAAVQTFVSIIHGKLVRKYNFWGATLALSFFQAATLITLTHSSGMMESWWWVYWVVVALLSGVFGTFAVIGLYFMVLVYFVSVVTEQLGAGGINIRASAIVLGSMLVACTISHLFWRKHYKKQENQRLAQLSGMLANKDQQANILIESIADGIILTNTEGKINLMNSAAAAMSQWPVEEALGIDVQLVMSLKEEDGKDIAPGTHPFVKVLTDKAKVEQTLKLTGRDRKEIVISLVVSPVILPGKNEVAGAVAVVRDISKAREEENRRADFVSTASHEMRTPVAAIEGYLQLAMNDKVSKIDAKARSYLQKALDSTHHLGQLFQDLLTSAKAEDGRLVSHPTVVEMGEFLEGLTDSLKFSAEKKGLLMEYTVGVSQQASGVGGGKVVKPLYYVNVDPDRLREVITNLFDNAVKYTETGRITIGLTGNDDVVQMFIKDTGPGISADDIPHLFQKFYRVDNTATRSIGGTGLGLFICKKIVELYQGRIWAESETGKGSTFYINLPRLSTQKASDMQNKGETQTITPQQ